MLIYIDSSVLCANFYMKGPSFEIMKKVGTIVLSQIVYDEVVNKFKEKLLEGQRKIHNGIDSMNELLSSPIPDPLTNDQIDSECKKYSDSLDEYIIESGQTILEPYPTIPHEQIVKRALLRKRPFKEDGSTGYRDYLIWMSCINVAKTYAQEDIHFISYNTRDFSDTKNKEDLHPDLIADLQEAEISNTRFHYWISVKEFVDKYANEIAQRIDDYKLLINEIEHNKTGFQEPIHGFVSSIIGMDLSDQGVLVPGVNPVLHSIEEEIVTHIEDIKDIGEEYLLDVNFDYIGMIESSINQDELKDYKGEFDFEVVSKKGNIAQINTTIGLQIKLRMTFSKIEKNISSIELIEVEDYYCPFCEYE